jgi:chemotaxis protein MotB
VGAPKFNSYQSNQSSQKKYPHIESHLNEENYIQEEMLLRELTTQKSEDGESLWLLSYSDMMTLLFGFFVLLMSFSKIDIEAFEKVKKETTTLFGGEYQKPFQQMKTELKDKVALSGLNDKAVFDELEKGLTITFRGSVFFESGSAELKPEAIEMLKQVIPIVKRQNSKFNVVVEGHTDDNPISSDKFPSNWELSSHRASAVLRLFEENGFEKKHLRAIGFADTLPVLPNRDDSNQAIAENQSQNRRIVLKLVRATTK